MTEVARIEKKIKRYLVSHTTRLVSAVDTGVVNEFNKGLGENVRLVGKDEGFSLKGRRFAAREMKRYIHAMHKNKTVEIRAALGTVSFKGDDQYPCVLIYENDEPASAICLEVGHADKKVKTVRMLADKKTVASMPRELSQTTEILASA